MTEIFDGIEKVGKEPPTRKQLDFLEQLCRETGKQIQPEAYAKLTKKSASAAIERLKRIREEGWESIGEEWMGYEDNWHEWDRWFD